ncbi:hypothetical protein [Flavobacterium sp.]|uniref:hypothetical protein n=1 Tax=Flavobacterium sp. TaxID=239 RepID=UPI00374DEFF8
MKIRKLKLLLALFVCLAYKSYGAPAPPLPQPEAIPPPVGDPAPIDSEIWILMLSGILLGGFFLTKKTSPKAAIYTLPEQKSINSKHIKLLNSKKI